MFARKTITLLAAMTLVVTACGGGGNGGPGGADSADDFDPTAPIEATLDWQMWVGGSEDQAAWEKVAEAVTAEYPGIEVKLQGSPWLDYWDRISAQLASPDAPCIVSMQSLRLASYAKALLPLDELIAAYDLDLDEFDPVILDAFRRDGQLVALPYDTGSWVIFYSKELFAQHGLDEPSLDWTWDDFKAAAKALTEGDTYGVIGDGGEGSLPWVLTLTGAEPVDEQGNLDLTDPDFVRGYEQYVGLWSTDGVAPPAKNMTEASVEQLVASGRVAMSANGPWIAQLLKSLASSEIGIAPMPAGPDGSKTYTAGSGFGIARGCKQPEAAFRAIMTMTGPDVLEELAKSGRALPARPAVADAWHDFVGIEGSREVLEYADAHSRPMRTSDNWVSASDLFNRYGTQALTGDLTPAQALERVQRDARP